MADFNTSYLNTSRVEGGYVNHPNDRGGETWAGIARRFNPTWEGWKIIDVLKVNYSGNELDRQLSNNEKLLHLRAELYRRKYWKEWMSQLPQPVADELYDQAVLHGPFSAQQHFQQALNLLSEGKWHLTVDGKVGQKTIAAYDEYMSTANRATRNKERNEQVLLKALNGIQFNEFREYCEKNPSQLAFFYGWIDKRI
jgi:lysozyme family protein